MPLLAIIAAAALGAAAQPADAPVLGEVFDGAGTADPEAAQPVSESEPRQIVPEGTPVRLMVLSEITSRNSHPGQKFMLRVDEPVYIDGKPVIPVGAKAWGEVVSVEGNAAAGRGGRLGAKLLYVDLPEGQVPLRGTIDSKGNGNGAGVAMAIVGFGVLGLLTAGNSARLKGGQTFTAYVDKAQ